VALFGLDFGSLFNAIKGFLGPVGKLIDKVGEGIKHVTTIIERATTLRDSVLDEIAGWKNFKQDIRIKQRVIEIEKAIEKTRDLIQGIPDSWNAILDIIKTAKAKFAETGGSSGEAVEEAAAAVEDAERGGVASLLKQFPKLAKGFEKFLGIVSLIVDGLEQISNVIDDLQTIVDELKRLRLEFEKLDTIFLSQSNKRRTVRLQDGSTIRQRIGALHPA